MYMRRRPTGPSSFAILFSARGIGLVDTLIALVLSAILVLMVAASLQTVGRTAVKAREQMSAARLAQSIESRFSAMSFFDILPADSRTKNGFFLGHPTTHRVRWAGSPAEPILKDIEKKILAEGFTAFTLDVAYLRRDSSDNDDDSSNMDFIAFYDGNNDYRDDNDPSIGFIQRTTPPGDFFGTGPGPDGDSVLPEVPDTHLRQVTLRLWKGNNAVVVRQSGIIAQEGWTGDEAASTESPIKLVILTPALNIKMYQVQDPVQYAAQQPFLLNEFPSNYKDKTAMQVDGGRPLVLAGKTAPNARLVFNHRYISHPPTVYGTFGPCHDDYSANDGTFRFVSYNCTPRFLYEGIHTLSVRANKDGVYSPYYGRSFLLDVKPPVIDMPTTHARTLSPVVRARIFDADTAGKRTYSSGLRLAAKNWGNFVTAESVNNSIAFLYRKDGPYVAAPTVVAPYISPAPVAINDPVAYWIEWASDPTMLPPALPGNGVYAVAAEGADNAMYRTRREWTLTVNADLSDTTPPPAPECGPKDLLGTNRPTFTCQLVEDPESGLNPYTLNFALTYRPPPTSMNPTPLPVTTDVVNRTVTPVLRRHYDPHTLQFTYTPPAALPQGEYTAVLTIKNWADTPGTAPTTWNFTVPAPPPPPPVP